jgi:hypothetical protein
MIGRESAWDGLQRTMRRVLRMRELGAEASMIGRDLDRSRQLWKRVAPTPPGMASTGRPICSRSRPSSGSSPTGALSRRRSMTTLRWSGATPCHLRTGPRTLRRIRRRSTRALRDVVARGDNAPSEAPRRAVEEMVAIYRALAVAGDPVACRELAECYARRVGDPPTGLQRMSSRHDGFAHSAQRSSGIRGLATTSARSTRRGVAFLRTGRPLPSSAPRPAAASDDPFLVLSGTPED